jgi:hypothetical protein
MPVIAVLLPVSSPESAGSRLAAAALEASCQLPVTGIAFADGVGVRLLEHPARPSDVVRRRLAPRMAQDDERAAIIETPGPRRQRPDA